MKKTKRWIALILAIALVSTNALYQLGTHMSASESDGQVISTEIGEAQNEELYADSTEQDDGSVIVKEVTGTESVESTEVAEATEAVESTEEVEATEVVESTEEVETAESTEVAESTENVDEATVQDMPESSEDAANVPSVQAALKKDYTRVYVYIKLDTASGIDSSKWNANNVGWYTIGYVDVLTSDIPKASTKTKDKYYNEYASKVNLDNIVYFSGNQAEAQGINLKGDTVKWSGTYGSQSYGLKVADGASSYATEAPNGTNQWHLDGLLTVKKIEQHSVTINYVYEDGTTASPSYVKQNVKTGDVVKKDSPVIDGYTADQSTVEVRVFDHDVTITVVYSRNCPQTLITVTAGSAEREYNGEPLTNDSYTYTEGILLEGHTLTAIVEGSQTEVGKSPNKVTGVIIEDSRGKDITKRYNVTTQDGTLKVTGTITVDSPEDKVYNGQEQKWTPKVTNGEKVLTEGTDYTVTYEKTDFTNVTGEIKVKIQGIGNYTGTVERSYKITQAPLTITTKGNEKVYDGEPLTEESMTIKGLVNGEKVAHKTTGSRTEVGESDNTYELDWEDENETTAKRGNYEIKSETLGKLVVKENKDEIVVTAAKVSETYDGQAHGTTVSVSTLPKGYRVAEAASTATATDVTATAVTARVDKLVIVNASGTDVTKKLTIKYVDGSITITPAPLTITTKGNEKVYDGEPLTEEGMTIEGLVNGEKVAHKTTGSRTEVGESDNTYELDWEDENETTAKRGNYEIKSETLGKLVVKENKDEIVVTAAKVSETYDGQAHGTTVSVSTLPKGYRVAEAASTATATDVTATAVTARVDKLVIVNASGTDVTKELTIKYVDGSITITPAPLTITTKGNEKVYDGEPLTEEGMTIEGLVNGEKVAHKTTGSRTEVGESDNTYELDWEDENETTAKRGNYEIKSETLGKLVVKENKDEIVVTAAKVSETYDGQAHGTTVSVSTLPKGYRVAEAASTATATDVTATAVTARVDKLVIVNASGTDVTKELTIKYVDGSITITPAPLTITTKGNEKVYDGEPLTEEGMTIEGLVNGEKVAHKTTGSRTEVGESDNTYELDWEDENETTAKRGNYEIKSETLGKLVVKENKDEIVVTAAKVSETYDGQAHGTTVSVSTLPKGYRVAEAASTATATDVTATAVTARVDKLVIVNASGTDVTKKLTIKYVDGSITITPAPLTITTKGNEKVYDGEPLTEEGMTIEGLVNGEKVAHKTTGSRTEVGESDNTYELDWEDENETTAKRGNYEIKSETLGKLVVKENKDEIVVTAAKVSETYDGQAHGTTVSVSTLPKGYRVAEAASTATATDVTATAVTARVDKLVIVNASGTDVTKELTIKYVDGSITITPAPLTITTKGNEKVYDGTPLTEESMTIEGLVNGEELVHKTTGTQTKVGDSDNTYAVDWNDSKTTAKEGNYEIKVEKLGKLVVKESEDQITVITTGGTYTYDGQPHKATVEVKGLPKGYEVKTASSDTEVTDVTKDPVIVTADQLVIVNADGDVVTDKLKITKVDGTILVNPATLTVTTASASKVYDGTALTADGTITGLVNGETVTFTVTGSITEVGTATNTYTISWPDGVKADNYVIEEHLGTLEVTVAETPATPDTPQNPDNTPNTDNTPQTPDNSETPDNTTVPENQDTTNVQDTPAQAAPQEPTNVVERVAEAIRNIPQAVEDTVKDIQAKVQEVVNPDEDAVPLGNQKLGDHKCCIFHFLVMLLTAILYGFFTHSMKKRQKKNFELREELDLELAKRGLPTSKEQKKNQ